MRNQEILNRIALTLIEEIGPVKANRLLSQFGTATEIFKAPKEELIGCIGEKIAHKILQKNTYAAAEKELQYLEKNNFSCLISSMPEFPQRLLNCPDAPSVLYCNGEVNLNAKMIVSVVGTRNNTSYGKEITEEFISLLPKQNMLIISGLAFGIDAIAHRAALQHQIPTVGVVAHGLDRIYPNAHRNLMKDMLQHQGAMLTEFMTKTYPEKHNFPRRNRIVAGMSDATIVIETDHKGGSMITAHLAFHYDRALFAVPGRITDPKSNGCNKLILQNKACIYSSMKDFLDWMNWEPDPSTLLSSNSKQKIISISTKPLHLKNQNAPQLQTTQNQQLPYFELSAEELTIISMLSSKATTSIDEIYMHSGLNSSAVATALLKLEIKNYLEILPGKYFKIKKSARNP